VDITTGKQLWYYITGDDIWSTPAVANGIVYFGSNSDSFFAVNLTDGSTVWTYRTGADVQSNPAIGSDGTVYVTSTDQYLYAFGVSSFPAVFHTAYAVCGDDPITVSVSWRQGVTGGVMWKFNSNGDTSSSPAILPNGDIVYGAGNGYMNLVDSTGKLVSAWLSSFTSYLHSRHVSLLSRPLRRVVVGEHHQVCRCLLLRCGTSPSAPTETGATRLLTSRA
jgi:outer membrane protein assembly factor BamB